MKIFIVVLALVTMGVAKPAEDYTQSAHVVSVFAGRGRNGNPTVRTCTYELRVGNLTYVAQQRTLHCDESVAVGMDVPIKLDGRKIKVLRSNGKEMLLDVMGTSE